MSIKTKHVGEQEQAESGLNGIRVLLCEEIFVGICWKIHVEDFLIVKTLRDLGEQCEVSGTINMT